MLHDFLTKIGVSDKEQAVYLALSTLGVQPASTIARRCNFDRVSTYRYLKRLADQGLVKVYVRDGVQFFGPAWGEGIESHLRQQIAAYESLLEEVPLADQALHGLSGGESLVPKLQVFEGKTGLKTLFRDILAESREQKLLRIRMLTSNTFEQQLGNVPLSKFMKEFFADLKQRSLGIEIIEASGTLLPEYIRKIAPADFNVESFPAARGATSVFIVGTALYLACYGDTPIGLKIKHEQMSQIFHFMIDAIGRKVPGPESTDAPKLRV